MSAATISEATVCECGHTWDGHALNHEGRDVCVTYVPLARRTQPQAAGDGVTANRQRGGQPAQVGTALLSLSALCPCENFEPMEYKG